MVRRRKLKCFFLLIHYSIKRVILFWDVIIDVVVSAYGVAI